MQLVKSLNISYEFFPPKTNEGREHLLETAGLLQSTKPQFFSVTFGAGGSTRQGTLETVTMLKQHITVPVVPHISCIGCEREEIIDLINTYQLMGITELVALRGDLPSGMGDSCEFKYASDLVTLIRENTADHFKIAVAAYPEFHPQAQNAHADLLNLKRKYQAGANYAITQYFFNPDAYFRLLDDCAKEHINFPIIPGIMPITVFSSLTRFSEKCGAEIPRWLFKRLENLNDDHEAIQQFGFEVVYQLCERLISGGAPGIHFYTLNKPHSLELVKQLKAYFSFSEDRKILDTQTLSTRLF